jgi:pimeloyl-ACP methyl ester carboxylesterase
MSQPARSAARFVVSGDGTQIAYDATGSGPVVILLHGGGRDRLSWHDAGYVSRLASEFTVVTVDLRGNGSSDKPTTTEAYAVERLREDILAVADAVGARRFTLWGFSYGANVGRYVAAASDRVQAMVSIGIPFGPAADGGFRAAILQLRAKWAPVIEAYQAGQLDLESLADADRMAWQAGTVPLDVAWLSALLDYPAVEPSDLCCPTLWLVGTANEGVMASVRAYEDRLAGTSVSLRLLDGLTHPEEFQRIDLALPVELEFTRWAATPDR